MRTVILALLLAGCSVSPQWSACDQGSGDFADPTAPPYRGSCPEGYECTAGYYCAASCVEWTWTGTEWSHSERDVAACAGLATNTTEPTCSYVVPGCVVAGCTVDSECPDGTRCRERGECRP